MELVPFLVSWIPTFIWIVLCVAGLSYGAKEISESKEDLSNVEKDILEHVNINDDPRVDVALGNFKTAWKNLATQLVFLFVGFLSISLKVIYPSDYEEVNLIRSIMVPMILITGEGFLVSQIKGMSRTREIVKIKTRKIFLDRDIKEENEKVIKARADNERKLLKRRTEAEEKVTKDRMTREREIAEDRAENERRMRENGL